MTRLLLLAAAIGLVGILSVPLLLSRRHSDADRYLGELAQWHERWGTAEALQERADLILDLQRIRPPNASVSGVERHRRYVRAHELMVLSEQAADALAESIRESVAARVPDPRLPGFGCDTVRRYADRADAIATETGVRLEWVASVCEVLNVAALNLGEVRSEATVDWLRDAIRAVGEGR